MTIPSVSRYRDSEWSKAYQVLRAILGIWMALKISAASIIVDIINTHTHTHTHCLEPAGSPHLCKFFSRAVPLEIWWTESSILLLYPLFNDFKGRSNLYNCVACHFFMEPINHAHGHQPKTRERSGYKNKIFNGHIPLVFQSMTWPSLQHQGHTDSLTEISGRHLSHQEINHRGPRSVRHT